MRYEINKTFINDNTIDSEADQTEYWKRIFKKERDPLEERHKQRKKKKSHELKSKFLVTILMKIILKIIFRE